MLPSAIAEEKAMCGQCEKIDARIAHFREMATYVMGRTRLDSIEVVIAKLEADKKALHPTT